MNLNKLYDILYSSYGCQGWWPLVMNESHSTDDFGYHKENVLIDKNHVDKYEITVGAILTQNTSWKNVMICIDKLKNCRIDTGEKFLNENEIIIKSCIRSAGYYNQKYKKLKLTIKHFYDNGFFENGVPERGELLELWGYRRGNSRFYSSLCF